MHLGLTAKRWVIPDHKGDSDCVLFCRAVIIGAMIGFLFTIMVGLSRRLCTCSLRHWRLFLMWTSYSMCECPFGTANWLLSYEWFNTLSIVDVACNCQSGLSVGCLRCAIKVALMSEKEVPLTLVCHYCRVGESADILKGAWIWECHNVVDYFLTVINTSHIKISSYSLYHEGTSIQSWWRLDLRGCGTQPTS